MGFHVGSIGTCLLYHTESFELADYSKTKNQKKERNLSCQLRKLFRSAGFLAMHVLFTVHDSEKYFVIILGVCVSTRGSNPGLTKVLYVTQLT